MMHCDELACESGHGSFAGSVRIYQSSGSVGVNIADASSISIVPNFQLIRIRPLVFAPFSESNFDLELFL